MKLAKLVCCFVGFASLGFASQAFSQDLSGWSDKTICRLASSQKDNSAYVQEATQRNLSCISNDAAARAEETANPLTKLKVVADWNPIKNREVFDQERAIIANQLSHHRGDGGVINECIDVLKNADNSLMDEIRGRKSKASWAKYSSYSVGHCIEIVPHHLAALGYTPAFVSEVLLHWAKNNMLNPLTNPSDKGYQDSTYLIPNLYSPWAAHYAFYYDEYEFTDEEREIVEQYLVEKLLTIDHTGFIEAGLRPCNPNSLSSTTRGALDGSLDIDGCDSIVWRTLPAKLALGLRLENQELFDKGIETTLYMLKFFDKKGIFVPYAAGKGAAALSYLKVVPSVLSVVSEILYTLEYDFLEHRLDNGIKIKDIFAAQIALMDNPKLFWKYVRNHGNYGNSDIFTRKNLLKWRKPEHKLEWWYHSGATMQTTIRESARYVDTYAPDLQHLRIPNYQEKDQTGIIVQLVSNYSFIEAYKWYEGNTKTVLDPVQEAVVNNDSSYQFNASRISPEAPKKMAKAMTRRYASSKAKDLFAGTYDIQWFIVNVNCSSNCERDYGAVSTLVLQDGKGVFAGEDRAFPSSNNRQSLSLHYDKKGNVLIYGDLDLYEPEPAYLTVFEGKLTSDAISTKWHDGDEMGFTIQKSP